MTPTCSTPRTLVALCLLAALAACSAPPKSYVVLLPDPDGKVGEVTVQGEAGTQTLREARARAGTDGRSIDKPIEEAALKAEFGAAMQAQPPRPEHYQLYFEAGSSTLTAESQTRLTQVLERVRQRQAVDMSIIGHTDTKGAADVNERLALERAQSMAETLRTAGLDLAEISVESHGERNLLIKTPDETDEPRNRRVEITLR